MCESNIVRWFIFLVCASLGCLVVVELHIYVDKTLVTEDSFHFEPVLYAFPGGKLEAAINRILLICGSQIPCVFIRFKLYAFCKNKK